MLSTVLCSPLNEDHVLFLQFYSQVLNEFDTLIKLFLPSPWCQLTWQHRIKFLKPWFEPWTEGEPCLYAMPTPLALSRLALGATTLAKSQEWWSQVLVQVAPKQCLICIPEQSLPRTCWSPTTRWRRWSITFCQRTSGPTTTDRSPNRSPPFNFLVLNLSTLLSHFLFLIFKMCNLTFLFVFCSSKHWSFNVDISINMWTLKFNCITGESSYQLFLRKDQNLSLQT